MIDEELYQQAADELNSDRRNPHIWARACALASDDHDEARYLYTNLRVEELIAERNDKDVSDGGESLESEEMDTTLALDPLNDKDDTEEAVFFSKLASEYGAEGVREIPSSTSAGVDDPGKNDDILSFLAENKQSIEEAEHLHGDQARYSVASNIIKNKIALGPDQAPESPMEQDFYRENPDKRNASNKIDKDATLNDLLDETSELDGAAVVDFGPEEFAEFQASIFSEQERLDKNRVYSADSSKDALQQNNEQLDELLAGVDTAGVNTRELPSTLEDEDPEAVLTADFTEYARTVALEHPAAVDLPDEEKLSGTLQPFVPGNKVRDDSDRFAQDLERQVDQLTGQNDDVIDYTESTADDRRNEVAAGTAAAAASKAAFASKMEGPRRDIHYSGAPRKPELPVDLSDGQSGAQYSVFRRDGQVQAVKSGVSWPALFLTLPFLIYRQMFGTAIVYLIMSAIVLTGFVVSGLSWMDAGNSASELIKASTVGFAFLSVLGMLYLPWRHANTWRCEKLERRGFELIAWVCASNPGKAISRARRATAEY